MDFVGALVIAAALVPAEAPQSPAPPAPPAPIVAQQVPSQPDRGTFEICLLNRCRGEFTLCLALSRCAGKSTVVPAQGRPLVVPVSERKGEQPGLFEVGNPAPRPAVVGIGGR